MLISKFKQSFAIILAILIFSFLLLSCDRKEETITSPEEVATDVNSPVMTAQENTTRPEALTADISKESDLISAKDVKDRESLKAFVLAAQKEIEENSLFNALPEFEKEGRWRQGSTYLSVVAQDGINLFHPINSDFESQNFIDFIDINGVKVTQELIKVTNAGGGFVEHSVATREGDVLPRVMYAVKTHFDYVLHSGLYE